jgi:hypothetical protein
MKLNMKSVAYRAVIFSPREREAGQSNRHNSRQYVKQHDVLLAVTNIKREKHSL